MSIYKEYDSDQLEELFSNYLIESWSYSKVNTFSRNEKSFEMAYLYGYRSKSSSSNVAGRAYHAGLELYWNNFKIGEKTDIIDLEKVAFELIMQMPADEWKIQKTTPSIVDCQNKAIKDASTTLVNFLSEIQVYESEIKEILGVELKIRAWVSVNGVDIPLPCNLIIDLVIKTNDGRIVLIDHKTKRSFTDEKEVAFVIGKQAFTYTLGYEEETRLKVDEVWFIENKISKNKDGSAQLVLFKSIMDKQTRLLYGALLYEPLKRMIEAVNNPDYVYLINDSDNFTDKAELYEFWAKTMIAEVDDFDILESKKPLIENRLRKIRDSSLGTAAPNVIKNFKKFTEKFIPYDLSNKDMNNQEKIEHVLRSFGIPTEIKHIFEGYSSTTYLLATNAGVPISKIQRYKLDIANALNVANVRINKDLFVYEDKSYLSVESCIKSTKTLFWDASKLNGYKIPIGEDNFKQTIYWDLKNHSTPHMLICGATGSGKTVSVISSIEYALAAGVNEAYIFDPKYEFTNLGSKPGVTVVCEIEEIELQMKLLVEQMQDRVRSKSNKITLVVFDEFADAVDNSRKGNDLKNYTDEVIGYYKDGREKTKRVVSSVDKSLAENLKMLLQKGRSTGYRIIAATQRASTKVITGDAKVNFPVRICYSVPTDIDSMVVIDEPGAESLNGRGDGLIKSPEYQNVVRFQAFFKEPRVIKESSLFG